AGEDHAQHIRGQAGHGVLAGLLARMFAQGMRHLVPHDHGHFVVGELEGIENAGVEGDLAARHAEGVDLLGTDQIDLPVPVRRLRIKAFGMRQQAPRNLAQTLELRMPVRRQRPLRIGLPQQFAVLLGRLPLHLLRRHHIAEGGGLADVDALLRTGHADAEHQSIAHPPHPASPPSASERLDSMPASSPHMIAKSASNISPPSPACSACSFNTSRKATRLICICSVSTKLILSFHVSASLPATLPRLMCWLISSASSGCRVYFTLPPASPATRNSQS